MFFSFLLNLDIYGQLFVEELLAFLGINIRNDDVGYYTGLLLPLVMNVPNALAVPARVCVTCWFDER